MYLKSFTIIALLFCFSCFKSTEPILINSVMIDRIIAPHITYFPAREKSEDIIYSVLRSNKILKIIPKSPNGEVLKVTILAISGNKDNNDSLKIGITISSKEYLLVSNAAINEKSNIIALIKKLLIEDLIQLEKIKLLDANSSNKLVTHIKNYLIQKKLAWHAVALLGQRKQADALDILCKLLVDTDEQLSNLTLNSLVQINDINAVPCIIDYAHRKPSHIRLKAISAIEKLGGKKGAEWLFTLSSGHNDEKVRNAAKKALESVESRISMK